MSAGLVTSTVTPGMTAPEASRAVPAICPSCARPAAGSRTTRAAIVRNPCNTRLTLCPPVSGDLVGAPLRKPAQFRVANRFSLVLQWYTLAARVLSTEIGRQSHQDHAPAGRLTLCSRVRAGRSRRIQLSGDVPQDHSPGRVGARVLSGGAAPGGGAGIGVRGCRPGARDESRPADRSA